jgi:hypothetical protein
VSFFDPVSAFEEDVAHCLAPVVTLALVGVGFLNNVEVGAQAYLAIAHLGENRANRSVCSDMYRERPFAGPYPEFEELSAVFSRFPGSLLFTSHRLTDDRFRGCCQDLKRL